MTTDPMTSAAGCPGDDSCKVPEHWPDPASSGPHRAPASAAPETVAVPLRWIDEVVLALDSATIIGIRSCNPGDGLNLGNHDRLIREAQQWSVFAREARSLPSHGGVRGR